MISKYKHTEMTPSGKPVYIIEAHYRDFETLQITNEINRDYQGERWEIPFRKGVGRTTSRRKAQLCSEMLEYVVVLHETVEPWPEISEYATPEAPQFDDETDDSDIDESE